LVTRAFSLTGKEENRAKDAKEGEEKDREAAPVVVV
jgi:hypothetical protein